MNCGQWRGKLLLWLIKQNAIFRGLGFRVTMTVLELVYAEN